MQTQAEAVLVAVDESDASRRAASYVAKKIGASEAHIRLVHVLPPELPKIVEHTSSLDAQKATLAHGQRVVGEMRDLLIEAGIDESRIETECYVPKTLETITEGILSMARDRGCDTIVTGRTSLPWFQELLHHHIGDAIVKSADGLSVWIVES